MTALAFITALFDRGVSAEAIRAEVFFLGGRHQGEALAGALKELAVANLEPRRSRLLRAVIADLNRTARQSGRPALNP